MDRKNEYLEINLKGLSDVLYRNIRTRPGEVYSKQKIIIKQPTNTKQIGSLLWENI